MASSKNLDAALNRWRDFLGSQGVVTGQEVGAFERCPSGYEQSIGGVIFPQSVEDVQRVVKIAVDLGVPLYPVSVGNNWGFGSAAPSKSGSVVLNLSRMNRVLAFDETQGIVTLEPGVSQQALYDYLGQLGHKFFTPITGSSPKSSIVGNALERGFGVTPQVDHFGAVIAIEAVLPDGALYRSAMYEARDGFDPVSHKWGVGPYLDGLFGQGNFGIVTKVVLQLAKRPPATATMFAIPRERKVLFEMVDAARDLLQESGLGLVSVKFINDLYAMAASHGPFRDLSKPLSSQERINLRGRFGIPEWSCWMAVYGNKDTVKLVRSLVKKFIRPLSADVLVLDNNNIAMIERMSRLFPSGSFPKTRLRVAALSRGQKYLQGQPNEGAFRMAYWRSGNWNELSQHSPTKDGCAFTWYMPLIPFKSKAVQEFIDFIERECAKIKVDPIINFTAISSNCFYGLVFLTFDEDSPDEVRIAAYQHILQEGAKIGLMPYRLPIFAMDEISRRASMSSDLAFRLKQAIDPNGIIAPGRYALSD